jgi:hypothetical protein
MVFWIASVVGLTIAYLFGSTPTGYLAGKLLKGTDIREHGSNRTKDKTSGQRRSPPHLSAHLPGAPPTQAISPGFAIRSLPLVARGGGLFELARRSAVGQIQRFPRPRPNGRCQIRKRSVAIDDWRHRLLSQALRRKVTDFMGSGTDARQS